MINKGYWKLDGSGNEIYRDDKNDKGYPLVRESQVNLRAELSLKKYKSTERLISFVQCRWEIQRVLRGLNKELEREEEFDLLHFMLLQISFNIIKIKKIYD